MTSVRRTSTRRNRRPITRLSVTALGLSLSALGVGTAVFTAGGSGCTVDPQPLNQLSSFRVEVTAVNGNPLPEPTAPLPANRGQIEEVWDFSVEARSPTGESEDFDGLVRVRVEPGTVIRVTDGEEDNGRNIRLRNGKATGQVVLTGVYGPARLWIEDIGYSPAPVGEQPQCSDGKNNDDDEDVLIDFPNDPGCAFADDDDESEGTYEAGTSQIVYYALPRLVDIQGIGTQTPYPFEGMEVNTADPQYVVVTRVTSDGFYVTDLRDSGGYNHMFAFNFSTPSGMKVCDRVTFLAGTVAEFFGFTELSFPSFKVESIDKADCLVPEPAYLDAPLIQDDAQMESIESGLVRLGLPLVCSGVDSCPEATVCCYSGNGMKPISQCATSCPETPEGTIQLCDSDEECGAGIACKPAFLGLRACGDVSIPQPLVPYHISTKFGPELANEGVFGANQSNCDFSGDGVIDFEGSPTESACANACNLDTECTEWSSYAARGNFKVSSGMSVIQVNTAGSPTFDPPANRGRDLTSVTGTLRNFSGGNLNWTVEIRCPADLICGSKDEQINGCKTAITAMNVACVRDETLDDNDQASN